MVKQICCSLFVKPIFFLNRTGLVYGPEDEEEEDLILDKERDAYTTPYLIFLQNTKSFVRKGPSSAGLVEDEEVRVIEKPPPTIVRLLN